MKYRDRSTREIVAQKDRLRQIKFKINAFKFKLNTLLKHTCQQTYKCMVFWSVLLKQNLLKAVHKVVFVNCHLQVFRLNSLIL